MKKAVLYIMVLGLCAGVLSGCGKDDKASSLSSVSPLSSVSSAVSSEAPVLFKIAVVKNANSGLNVRGSASSDGEVLGTVENGDKFELNREEPDGDWYVVTFEGQTGYLFNEYVDVEEVTQAELDEIRGDSEDSEDSALVSEASTEDSSASSTESEKSESKAESDDDVSYNDQDVEN